MKIQQFVLLRLNLRGLESNLKKCSNVKLFFSIRASNLRWRQVVIVFFFFSIIAAYSLILISANNSEENNNNNSQQNFPYFFNCIIIFDLHHFVIIFIFVTKIFTINRKILKFFSFLLIHFYCNRSYFRSLIVANLFSMN